MKKILIIAEAGVNHNGDFETAKKMIDVAKTAGADIVKFQTAIPHLVMTNEAPKAEYQINKTGIFESQLEMSKKFHLPLESYIGLKKYCDQIGIKFLSTPFDEVSMKFLFDIGMEIFKIPSGEITNLPYLKKVSFLAKEIILSTGMSTLDEIDFAIEILTSNKKLNKTNISILHCNTEYPTPYDDVNLNVLSTLKERYNTRVGYSDHTIGIEVPIAAVGIGAEIIEKHFTLDKSLPGPDQECSLNPEELINLVTSIRNIEKSFGTSEKKATKSEEKNKIIARRSIHIIDNLQLGHVLTEGDLIMKRPGDGISPINIENILGKKIIKDLSKDHKLNYNDIE